MGGIALIVVPTKSSQCPLISSHRQTGSTGGSQGSVFQAGFLIDRLELCLGNAVAQTGSSLL